MAIYRLKSIELRLFVDPLDGVMWQCDAISEEEIGLARASGVKECRSWENDGLVHSLGTSPAAREYHINRVATLFDVPLNDNLIIVLENHNQDIRVYLNDGNHRLAAAYIRGDEWLTAVVAASAPDKVCDTLSSAVKL